MFHHPVGIFPAGARWYLAAIAVLALLCVAMHLFIQAHAQQQAASLIHAWGKQASVEIADVRYHLLRNGLILQGIQIKRGDDSLTIEHILVRANPALLTSPAPRIGKMEISGLKAELRHRADNSLWQHDQRLKKIWQATNRLTLQDGQLKLYLTEHASEALELNSLTVRQQHQASIRSITASARSQDGWLDWQWHVADDSGNSRDWQSRGQLNWQHMDAAGLIAALALKPMAGRLSGHLSWQEDAQRERQKSIQQPSLNIQAEMRLEVGSDGQFSNGHHLGISGTKTDGLWALNIKASAWPLEPWNETLPQISGRKLIAAQWDGSSQWRGQPGAWKINAAQGVLQDVIYADQQNKETSAWYWGRINYSDVAINMAKRRLHVGAIDMLDSRLVLQAAVRQNELFLDDIASSSDLQASRPDLWAISADNINIHNMMLALALPQGKVTLTDLDGQCKWPRGGALSFKLKTAQRQASDNIQMSAAHTAKSKKENPTALSTALEHTPTVQWRLRGTADSQGHRNGQLSEAHFKVRGKHIPIASLRALLPLQGNANSPAGLAGQAEINAEITVKQGQWQMQGKASARQVQLTHGGEQWLVGQIRSRFGPVGTGLATQQLEKLEVHDWHYIAAMQPLSPAPSISGAAPESIIYQPVWWASAIRNKGLHINGLNFHNGTISVGQKESVWAEKINIKLDRMAADYWSNMNIEAVVGGGQFHLQGEWDALSDVQRFRGTASLQHALPFFLHDWMTASGMPRLMRGRLHAYVKLADGSAADSYQGTVKVRLMRPLTETGVFAADPMLTRTGFSTYELLQRLRQGRGTVQLQQDFSGLWQQQRLTLERLGLSVQEALQQAASNNDALGSARQTKSTPSAVVETRVRLRARGVLSLNERIRVAKVVAKMKKYPAMVVDLRAKWTGQHMTSAMQQRIARTQHLIERYMAHRDIDAKRVFLLWPTAEDQAEEIGSIQLETRLLKK